ncbi:MAG: hypothetical protein ACK5YO_10085, partial [Planctomyces sp.]
MQFKDTARLNTEHFPLQLVGFRQVGPTRPLALQGDGLGFRLRAGVELQRGFEVSMDSEGLK